MDKLVVNVQSEETFDENAWWSDFFLGVILGQVVQGNYDVTTEFK